MHEHAEQIMAIESQRWKYAGAKDQAIRETLDMSATHYYLALDRMLDDADAEARWPALVKRLRRVREARRKVRQGSSR